MTTTRPGLTAKQQRAFNAILAHQAAHGQTPSFAELRQALGVSSKSGVARLIDALVERGYVIRLPNRARSIAVVDDDKGPLQLAPALRAKLEAYCRLKGEMPDAVIHDVLTLFLDAEAGEVAA